MSDDLAVQIVKELCAEGAMGFPGHIGLAEEIIRTRLKKGEAIRAGEAKPNTVSLDVLERELCAMPVYLAARTGPDGVVTFHDLAMKREDVSRLLKRLRAASDAPERDTRQLDEHVREFIVIVEKRQRRAELQSRASEGRDAIIDVCQEPVERLRLASRASAATAPEQWIVSYLRSIKDPYEEFTGNAEACRFCFARRSAKRHPARNTHHDHCIWQVALSSPSPAPQHVCGTQGFGALGDVRPACEASPSPAPTGETS